MDVLADVLYDLSSKDADVKLRVPLSALIDYKGFRCLAVAKVSVRESLGPAIGFDQSGKYVPLEASAGLADAFMAVGDELNLAPNAVASGREMGQGSERVPVSMFAAVYKMSGEKDGLSTHNDEPSKKSTTYHFNELNYMEQKQLHYVLKTSEIFPLDYENDGRN